MGAACTGNRKANVEAELDKAWPSDNVADVKDENSSCIVVTDEEIKPATEFKTKEETQPANLGTEPEKPQSYTSQERPSSYSFVNKKENFRSVGFPERKKNGEAVVRNFFNQNENFGSFGFPGQNWSNDVVIRKSVVTETNENGVIRKSVVTETDNKNGVTTTKTVVITRVGRNEPDLDDEDYELVRSATGKALPHFDAADFAGWAKGDDFLDHVPLGARAVGIHIPKVETHKVKFEEAVPKRHSTDRGSVSEFVDKPDCPEAPEFDNKSEVEEDDEFKMMVDPAPTKDEMTFFIALNKARTEPKYYAKFIKEMLTHFNDRDRTFLFPNEKVKLMTHEGRKAFDEAIAFLKKQKPLKPFELSTGMSLAARDLVADHGPRNMGGHIGSDRSTMDIRMNFYGTWSSTCGENCGYGRKLGEHMVAQLIADDGVANRGHRDNIYKPEFHKVGVATGPHYSYGQMVVNDFAGDYYEDPREKQIKAHRNRLLYFFVHEDKKN